MQSRKISIIIPAHNEQRLITTTLQHALSDGALTECYIVVVANGCTDNTVSNVNAFIHEQASALQSKQIIIEVLDVEKASKTNAINIGISHAPAGVAVLLDADINIGGQHLLNLVNCLSEKVLAASPKLIYDTSQSSRLVKWYYAIAAASPYNKAHRISNVIALTEKAQKKIGNLPNVIADDEYIRRCFHHSEYQVITEASFTFICPKDVFNLLNVLTRVERGNLQLQKLNVKDHSDVQGLSAPFTFSVHYITFVVCKIIAKYRAKWQFFIGKINQWERDESNR